MCSQPKVREVLGDLPVEMLALLHRGERLVPDRQLGEVLRGDPPLRVHVVCMPLSEPPANCAEADLVVPHGLTTVSDVLSVDRSIDCEWVTDSL